MDNKSRNRREGLHADGIVESKHVETEDDLITESQEGGHEKHTKDKDENLDRAASTTQEEQEDLE